MSDTASNYEYMLTVINCSNVIVNKIEKEILSMNVEDKPISQFLTDWLLTTYLEFMEIFDTFDSRFNVLKPEEMQNILVYFNKLANTDFNYNFKTFE